MQFKHFQNQETFDNALSNNLINENDLCYIKDSRKVYTHGSIYEGASGKIYVGTCSTDAATVEKTITVESFPIVDSNPLIGTLIGVKFSATNTASTPTLNVNNLGAKNIWYSNAIYTAKSNIAGYANRYTYFMWDGTYWVWISGGIDNNTTYTNVALGQGYASCTTAESTIAKTAALSSYTLTANGIVSIKFTNAVPASSTLNISSKGAKAMYYMGSPIKSGIIKAGDTATFIYNTYYHLISIDRQGLPSGYTPSTLTGEDLALDAGDTFDVAIGKIEKNINDNEKVTASALVDLDTRITSLEAQIGDIESVLDEILGEQSTASPTAEPTTNP